MHFARVKVPPSLPRFMPIDAPAGETQFVLIEDVIAHNLDALFPGMRIRASYCFRVTRDADLDLQEDEADDLLRAIESELRKRRFGEPVRLEVEAGMPASVREMLLEALALERGRPLRDRRPARRRRTCWTLVGDRPAGAARPAVHAGDPEAARRMRPTCSR